jgi:hypothetical protein
VGWGRGPGGAGPWGPLSLASASHARRAQRPPKPCFNPTQPHPHPPGPVIVPRIKQELAACLARDGFARVEDAVGADHPGIKPKGPAFKGVAR